MDNAEAGSTRVSIETPPLSVSVEAPGVSLAEAHATAVAIYRQIWREDMAPPEPGTVVGFHTERRMDHE